MKSVIFISFIDPAKQYLQARRWRTASKQNNKSTRKDSCCSGMELLVGYKLYNEKFDNERYYSFNDNGILFSIGFQIHLKK